MTTIETTRNKRRGVTLLLVLALMAMFAMLVVTFMIVTTQAKNAAVTTAQAILYPKDIGVSSLSISSSAYGALDALLVGGLDNAIGPHGILENLYGHPVSNGFGGVSGTFGSLGTDTGDNTAKVIYYNNGYFGNTAFDDTNTSPFYRINLIGKVVTVTELPSSPTDRQKELLGKSTFVIAMHDGRVELAPFPVSFNAYDQATALNGCRYIVNSPAFSGTGPGYEPYDGGGNLKNAATAVLTDQDGDGVAYVLRPNAMAPDSNGDRTYRDYLGNNNNIVLMNPDYTAPDLLNMFLAWYDVDESNDKQIGEIIPSFHRPQLLRAAGVTTSSAKHFVRKMILRPTPFDHPDFTGSNPAAQLTTFLPSSAGGNSFVIRGPWDVDNDGDGIADSVWLDVGLPILTDSVAGKIYKPLAAFLVLDMDGRLNVNTHGNVMHDGNFDSGTAANPGFGDVEVRGAGAGPAEVRIEKYIGASQLEEILFGNGNLTGRYGLTVGSSNPGPGVDDSGDDNDLWIGPTNNDDKYLIGKHMGVNPLAYNDPNGAFGTDKAYGGLVPDWWGQFPLAFDPLGNRYVDPSTIPSALYWQNPYLMNPYGDTPATADSHFGADVLQFLLRLPGDVDYTNLPVRLRELLGENTSDVTQWSDYRFHLTTRSSDIPSPSYYVAGQGSLFHLIMTAVSNNSADALTLLNLLPEELRRGEKINLNRLSLNSGWTDPTDQSMLKEKAKFAHGIYLLLSLLCKDQMPTTGNTLEGLTSDQIATRLAQWSTNLVDFMDPDAVMTPLIFSTTPFTNADLNNFSNYDDVLENFLGGTLPPGANARVVWGMERPEVALTKTFATHNLRIADAKDDTEIEGDADECGECGMSLQRVSATGCPGKDGKTHDKNFDQVLIPQGSLFLEIYHKGDPSRSVRVTDLYDDDNKLNLAKQVNDIGSYVWRLAISAPARVAPGTEDSDSGYLPTTSTRNDVFNELATYKQTYSFQPKQGTGDDGDPNLRGDCEVTFERFIFFGGNSPNIDSSDPCYDENYYCNYGSPDGISTDNVKLEPNEYLVIGPRKFTSFKSTEVASGVSFGTPTGGDNYQIDLEDDILDGSGGKRPKVMVAAAPLPGSWSSSDAGFVLSGAASGIGVSVSERLPNSGYYDEPTAAAADALSTSMGVGESGVLNNGYATSDESSSLPLPMDRDEEFYGFGTIPCYKSIFLQRLADPTREYDAVSNPYITVDWNMIDLHVFNSERDGDSTVKYDNNLFKDSDVEDSDTHLNFNIDGGLYFEMRQWGFTAKLDNSSEFPNIWDRTFDYSVIQDKQAGLGNKGDEPKLGTETVFGSLANYDGVEPETTNEFPSATDPNAAYDGAPNKAWQHYAWNDAPLTNTLELMQVPASTASRFGFECRDNVTIPGGALSAGGSLGTNGRFGGSTDGTPVIGPYLNFFDNTLNLSRLLEFVRVPSRFTGTIRGWTGDGKPIYAMREPGKINLNTANASAWKALSGNLNESNTNEWMPYERKVEDTKTYYGLKLVREKGGYASDASPPTFPSEFAFPFRSPNAGNLVPSTSDSMVRDESRETTILREAAGSTDWQTGTFFRADENAANQFTMLENIQRLSDVTTHRSNVFAVWVTIGYFEVDKYEDTQAGVAQMWSNHSAAIQYFPSQQSGSPPSTPNNSTDVEHFRAVYPDGCVFKAEKGLGDGTVTRNRAFFLIDRSTPVGFRRGQNYPDKNDRPSIRNVIVLERPLE